MLAKDARYKDPSSGSNLPRKGVRPKSRIFFYIVSGSERTYTFRVLLNALSTLATLVRDTYRDTYCFTP